LAGAWLQKQKQKTLALKNKAKGDKPVVAKVAEKKTQHSLFRQFRK
jgi:hypothetical protein